jgi:D-glucosaminate-6-phosphate ammonia-lyase
MAGLDIRKIDRLPDTFDIPNEIIILRCQRNGYDRCLRAAGDSLIEVGNIGRPRAGYTDA